MHDDKLDFMYCVMLEKQRSLNEALALMQDKVGTLFAVTAALVALYSGLLQGRGMLVGPTGTSGYLRILPIAGFLATIFALAMSARTRHFGDAPHEDTIYSQKAFDRDYLDLKNQVIADMKSTYIKNTKATNEVARWVNWSVWLLFASIAFALISSLI